MMNVAERKQATAPAEAQRWLESFEAALQASDADGGGRSCFCADGLWRDVLAFTWNDPDDERPAAIEATLRETLARTQPRNFHIPDEANAAALDIPRRHRSIEALFEFETAFGRGAGVVRLDDPMPRRLRAWTMVTTLEELRAHEEGSARVASRDRSRDFGARELGRPAGKARAYADRDPTVLVVGGGQAGLSIAARLISLASTR